MRSTSSRTEAMSISAWLGGPAAGSGEARSCGARSCCERRRGSRRDSNRCGGRRRSCRRSRGSQRSCTSGSRARMRSDRGSPPPRHPPARRPRCSPPRIRAVTAAPRVANRTPEHDLRCLGGVYECNAVHSIGAVRKSTETCPACAWRSRDLFVARAAGATRSSGRRSAALAMAGAQTNGGRASAEGDRPQRPWHFLYLRPLPQ